MNPRLIIVTVVVGAALTGCGSQLDTVGEEFRDVRVANRDDTPADIIQMPEGYSNVAAKCDGTARVYVTRNDNGRAVAVAPNHPSCGG